MNHFLTIVSLSLSLVLSTGAVLDAQTYEQTPISISKEKVKNNGKLYYSHVVLEKQTLYSISKAYNVSVEEIYEANPTQNLEKEGLKKNAILLIPVKEGAASIAPAPAPVAAAKDDFFYHTAKWFEDLDSIAEKYGTTADVLMAFNGMKNKTIAKKQKIKIPRDPSKLGLPTATVKPAEPQIEETPKQETNVAPVQDTKDQSSDNPLSNLWKKMTTSAGKEDLSAVLMLPFNAQARPSEDDLDFYSGALLAVKDLSDKGISTDLNVYDVATSMPITRERLAESDVVIGPASTADINKALTLCPDDKFIISPLDLRGETIARENGNVIQKPTPLDSQYKDVIDWIGQDMRSSDKMIVISEKGAKATTLTSALTKHLSESGLTYANLTYGILEGRNIATSLTNMMTSEGANRVIIVSESEAFVNDAVRNLSLLTHRKYNVVLYAPAKIRSFETIDVEDFHKVNLHVSMSYYVDYASEDVKHFLLGYRALNNTEPSPFAYQGYDTAKFFLGMASKYGENWADELLGTKESGLQANFKFIKTEAGGYVNVGVRRVEYGSDFSINLVK